MKKGFTLAELLVAIGVIGVVSALTLPALTANAHNSKMKAAKQAARLAIEDGFGTMLIDEDVDTISQTTFMATGDYSNLANYIKILDRVGNNGFKLPSGAIVNIDRATRTVTIDVNGTAGPNTSARNGNKEPDQYQFTIDNETGTLRE